MEVIDKIIETDTMDKINTMDTYIEDTYIEDTYIEDTYMEVSIQYRCKIKFFTYEYSYDSKKYVDKLSDKLFKYLNKDLTESIKYGKESTLFIPHSSLNVSSDSDSEYKFVSENLNKIVYIDYEGYLLNYDNNSNTYYLDAECLFTFNTDKKDITKTDVESLIYDNINQLYSSEDFSINLDKERLIGNKNVHYYIEIIDTPENIKFSYENKTY